MTYSFNRVRTAALKSLDAMQTRLENISADFADVDMYLVSQAEQCSLCIEEFKEALQAAEDPFDGARSMEGHTLQKVRRFKRSGKTTPPPSSADPDLFAGHA